jgi:transcriptional regulator with XRE-family HTH domain
MNFNDYLEQRQEASPEFRRRWEASEATRQVSRVIVATRSRLGWTQGELAQRMGTTQAIISRAETTGQVTPDFLARFAEAVGGTVTLRVKVPGSKQLQIGASELAQERQVGRRRQQQRRETTAAGQQRSAAEELVTA